MRINETLMPISTLGKSQEVICNSIPYFCDSVYHKDDWSLFKISSDGPNSGSFTKQQE